MKSNETVESTEYSIIFYIHGDSDYLYHLMDGTAVYADEQALLKAVNVAESAVSGEVFIIYQQPRKHLLGIFPRRKNRLYYYRHGELFTRAAYRHEDTNEFFLSTESDLFHQLRSRDVTASHRSFFLFFGHEIPGESNSPYHNTLPGVTVNTASFVNGLSMFKHHENSAFDLVVLSTCNNGTPAMVMKMSEHTRNLLASPQNLHLSHMDPGLFSLLETEPDADATALAKAVADETFVRLTASLQTAVTLSVYEMDRLNSSTGKSGVFAKKYQESGGTGVSGENIDCADIEFFDEKELQDGVTTWFRPPAFGKSASLTTHSGWGCKEPS